MSSLLDSLYNLFEYKEEALSAFDIVAKALGYQKTGQTRDVVNEKVVEALKILLKPTFFLKIGGVFGALALSIAVYGAHVPELQNNLQRRQIYEKGYKMQLVHSVALALSDNCNKPYLTGGLFTLGIFLYSGSCYVHVLSGNAWYRNFTHAGEAVLVTAWFSMLIP